MRFAVQLRDALALYDKARNGKIEATTFRRVLERYSVFLNDPEFGAQNRSCSLGGLRLPDLLCPYVGFSAVTMSATHPRFRSGSVRQVRLIVDARLRQL